MGSGGMPPATSAKAMVKLINGLTPEKSATFYKFDGEEMPW